jgi:hypothetical protein
LSSRSPWSILSASVDRSAGQLEASELLAVDEALALSLGI